MQEEPMNLFDVEELFSEYPDFKFEFNVNPAAEKCGNETVSWLLKNSGSFTATDGDHHELLFTRNPEKEKKYVSDLIVFTTEPEYTGCRAATDGDGTLYDEYESHELVYNRHINTVFMLKRVNRLHTLNSRKV